MLGSRHVLTRIRWICNFSDLLGVAAMKMSDWRKGLLLAVCSAMAFSIGGHRASADELIDPGQHAFISQYVSAITSRSKAELKKLLHPKVLACMTEENRDFFDFMIDREIGYSEALRGGYTIMRLEGFNSDPSFSPPEELYYHSVAPTQEYQLDINQAIRGRSVSLIRQIVFADDRWFGVMVCPTTKGLELFRADLVEEQQQKVLVRDRVKKMAAPLLARLKVLLAQRHRVEAIELYQSESQSDLKVAHLVIDALEEN
jgi:hypothetical protein